MAQDSKNCPIIITKETRSRGTGACWPEIVVGAETSSMESDWFRKIIILGRTIMLFIVLLFHLCGHN
jgi:hypothetical protein